jgi:hypothetical protein
MKKAAPKCTRINQLSQGAKTALLIREIQKARAVEVVALISMNGKLAEKLEGLVDTAVEQASRKKKPDTRLLRLIVRYASAATRRMPGLTQKGPMEEVTEEELRAMEREK